MFQAMLADRFKLVGHNETQAMPAYKLTAGKRPALKKAEGSGDTGCKFTIQAPQPPTPGAQAAGAPVLTVPSFVYTCRNMTMTAFADGMRGMIMAQQVLNGNPVVDQTELKGAWDFDFKYSMRMPIAGAASDTVTIIDAVEKQLGLKMDVIKLPMTVFEVDHVARRPTENSPGVTESLKATEPPSEFEVADIKPTDPEFRGMRFQIQPGGRVNFQGITLKFLIQQAWNINEDLLVGAPKWMDTDRYDVIAKASTTGPGAATDRDAVFLMVRSLLADRFKLTTHNEDRPVAAYTLLAVKPKMKKADPNSRTRFKEGPPADGKDPRIANPTLSRLITFQNTTMAQFAEQLQSTAGGYIRTPVSDATGLEGGWDFTLNFSPAGILQGGGGRGRGGDTGEAAGAMPTAAEPVAGLTVFEAVEKQLGLKLELQKRPISVLVIDHVERKPTDN
jgi:uncharacterized protein (TIGR03435 family)